MQIKEIEKESAIKILSACDTLCQVIQKRQYGNRLLLNPWIFRLSPDYDEHRKAFQYLRGFARNMVEERKKEIAQKVNAVGKIKPKKLRVCLENLPSAQMMRAYTGCLKKRNQERVLLWQKLQKNIFINAG